MLKRLYIFLATCVIGPILFIGTARVVFAETIIDDGYLENSADWTASSSPYIIRDTVIVPPDRVLTIEPGVTVIGDPSLAGYSAIQVSGRLEVQGTAAGHVNMSGAGSISIMGTSSLSYADIDLDSGISISNGHTDIVGSTIHGAFKGIDIGPLGTAAIADSQISDNAYGIFVEPISQPIFQANIGDTTMFGTGGIGNALDDADPELVTISHSSLLDNNIAAIKNDRPVMVSAMNNWWGSENGPGHRSRNGK